MMEIFCNYLEYPKQFDSYAPESKLSLPALLDKTCGVDENAISALLQRGMREAWQRMHCPPDFWMTSDPHPENLRFGLKTRVKKSSKICTFSLFLFGLAAQTRRSSVALSTFLCDSTKTMAQPKTCRTVAHIVSDVAPGQCVVDVRRNKLIGWFTGFLTSDTLWEIDLKTGDKEALLTCGICRSNEVCFSMF